ncbi:ABC transporter substrate-binding protein [Clostridium tarantellae]|nr:ABC transporter substrate-binding protein [Clostridium tarantellae]
MKKSINLIFFIVISVLLISCNKISSLETTSNKEDESIIYSVESIPSSLLPNLGVSVGENDLICSLFEGLVEVDEKGNIIPALSEGWKLSDNKLEYTFIIKKDIKWSNGNQIKAKDFEDYFKDLLSPQNKNFIGDELDSIYGVKEYRSGKNSFNEVAIKAIDEFTLAIKMNKVDDDLLYNLTKPIYRLRDLKSPLNNYLNDYTRIKYSGPYIINSLNKDTKEIKLIKNKFYPNNAGVNEIVFIKSEEKELDFAAYNIGKIDVMKNPPITLFKEGNLLTSNHIYTTNIMKILIFNCDNAISGLLDFRKGIMNALNLELMDSYIIKNNIGKWNVNELNYLQVVEKDISNKPIEILDNYDKRQSYYTQAIQFFYNLNIYDKTIRLIGKDTLENQFIGEFIRDLLKSKYSIKVSLNLYDEEKLKDILEAGQFEIYIGELDLNEENFTYEFINSNSEIFDKNLSIISLYNINDIWCKSDKIKYLFVDKNGNIIFKYINKNLLT